MVRPLAAIFLLGFAACNHAGPMVDPRLVALMPAGTQEAITQMAALPKDPNMEQEFEHLLYWMGEQRRCQVKHNKNGVSVLGVMVMLERAYSQFKPILPNLESLLMLASMPRREGEPATQVYLHCYKKEPVVMLDWLLGELERYRSSQS